jgi:hypothetical protein
MWNWLDRRRRLLKGREGRGVRLDNAGTGAAAARAVVAAVAIVAALRLGCPCSRSSSPMLYSKTMITTVGAVPLTSPTPHHSQG